MRLVHILWEDAQCLDNGPWVYKQEWEYKPCLVNQVGYVLLDTEEILIITDAYNDSQTGAIQQIPKGMIKTMMELHV